MPCSIAVVRGDAVSYRSLLSERRFLLLLLGQSVSTTGDWLASVALLVFAYQRTGSGLAVGAMGFSQPAFSNYCKRVRRRSTGRC